MSIRRFAFLLYIVTAMVMLFTEGMVCFAENQAAKQMVYKAMHDLGLNCIPSEGNFILHEIGMDLKPYQHAMSDRHIRVGRDMGVGQRWNRLSMGTVDEMAYFLEVFRSLHS